MFNTENIFNIFPPYFHLDYFYSFLIVFFLLYILYRLAIKLLFLIKTYKQEYILLEVKPTDRNLKKAISTKQLFTILHSIEKPNTWYERLIGFKKPISYELLSSKKEGIRYLFRIPKQDISSIKKTLLAYLSGVEIKEVEDYVNKNKHNFIELSLKNKYIYPLADQPDLSHYDHLAYITAQMTKLKENEQVAIQSICSPINEFSHSKEISFIKDALNRLHNNKGLKGSNEIINLILNGFAFIALSPITIVSWFVNDARDAFPFWLFENNKQIKTPNDLYSSIEQKLKEPLFETNIRVSINIDSKEEYKNRLKGIVSSFNTFSTQYQSLEIKKDILYYLNSKYIKSFKCFLFKNRFSILTSKTILSVNELSDLYHFPYTETTKTEDLLQVKSPKLPAPISLKQNEELFDIEFANNVYGESITPIGLTLEERRRHTYIVGATGTGKTTLLTHMIDQDIKSGRGLAVIDPHGDLAEKILGIVPENRIKDVIYFNPYDIEFPIGLNLLEIPQGLSEVELQREKDFITSSLISVFHKLYDAKYSGPRMEHILRNVILTALEQKNPTLFTIYELLTNIKYRKRVVSKLDDEILKSFWKNEFEKLGSYQKAEQISPITNKLGRFLTTGITRNILNQNNGKLNFEDIMNNNKILICNLSKGKIGEDVSSFLGGLLTAKIQLTALRRVNIEENKRNDFFLYIDEFQNFATMSFAQILSEARKYRLSVILAHQNTVQIENDLLEIIIGNTGTIICFRTSSPKDESKLLPIFSPEVEKGQIANIPSYNFYIKINALQPQATFSGEIKDFKKNQNSEVKELIINNSRKVFGIKLVEKQKAEIKDLKTKKENTGTNIFELTN